MYKYITQQNFVTLPLDTYITQHITPDISVTIEFLNSICYTKGKANGKTCLIFIYPSLIFIML